MPTYSTPGAYIEWRDASAPAIDPSRTDITGFIGLAQRGPIATPVPVESTKQFEAHFGSFIGQGFLAYAVRGFFENGGRRCWVIRVAAAGGARPARSSSLTLTGAGAPRWQVSAASPGVWGDGLTLQLTQFAPARTVTVAGAESTRYLNVASVANFQRADLLCLTQPGLPAPLYRVVSYVDGGAKRLYFVHPDAGSGLPYDQTLDAYDRGQPLQVQSVAWTASAREQGWPVAFFPLITAIPEHPNYGPVVLAAREYPLVIPPGSPLPAPPPPIVITELVTDPMQMVAPLDLPATAALSGGADGLADLTVDDFFAGMDAVNTVDEVALVAAPDTVVVPEEAPAYAQVPPAVFSCLPCPPPAQPVVIHQPPLSFETPPRFSDDDVYQMQSRLVQLCEERNDRFALLDPTADMAAGEADGMALVEAWRARFESKNAALYFPWLEVVDPLAVAPTRRVPPSGHVAGICAQLDLAVGVHRAPANIVLSWAEDATLALDAPRHGELNDKSVNVLRAQPGLGLRILGARTLSSDPSWRFVNVRRLILMIMKAINAATQWAVFEPNDAATRGRINQALTEFLRLLWRRGALIGTTPAQAFAVRCDEVNNPAELRADGQLIAEVAVSPSRPFEYVVLRLGRHHNAFEVVERGTVGGGA